jgi:hypothetical protein
MVGQLQLIKVNCAKHCKIRIFEKGAWYSNHYSTIHARWIVA